MMRHIILLILYLVILTGITSAQADTLYIAEIKKYVAFVDTLSDQDYCNKLNEKDRSKNFGILIEEGSIMHKERKLKGGFSIYTTSEDRFDSVYKINPNDNLQKYLVKNYYYKNNKLVLAKVELQDWNRGMKVLYERTEYYMNDNLILRITPIDIVKKKDRWRINIDLYENGKYYLKRYLDDRKNK